MNKRRGRVGRTYKGVRTIKRRVDVKQAAELLGISSEGVRQRIRRGTLESHKSEDGRVYVWVDAGDVGSEHDKDGVITRLEGEVDFLRRELATRDEEIRRRDAILLSLSEGLKALNPPPEPASEPREGSVTSSEDDDSRGEGRGGTGGPPRRPWYQRILGQ